MNTIISVSQKDALGAIIEKGSEISLKTEKLGSDYTVPSDD